LQCSYSVLEHLDLEDALSASASSGNDRRLLAHVQRANLTFASYCKAELLRLLPQVRVVRARVFAGSPSGGAQSLDVDMVWRLPFALTVLPLLEILILSTEDDWWQIGDTPKRLTDELDCLLRSLAGAQRELNDTS
ncbi:unnamed protein product, partial [Polarella glacialis]